jgi:single-strand DNA-binding protein
MQKNRIELAGYLAAKPEARTLPSGTPVANARLAEGYKFKDRDGQLQEHTNWHSVVFYGSLADMAVAFEKGDNIFVEGTLQTRKFLPRDGGLRTVHEIVARSVHQVTKPRFGKETPPENEPHANGHAEPAGSAPHVEIEDDGEIWPS